MYSHIYIKYNLSQGDQEPNLKCEDDCPAFPAAYIWMLTK